MGDYLSTAPICTIFPIKIPGITTLCSLLSISHRTNSVSLLVLVYSYELDSRLVVNHVETMPVLKLFKARIARPRTHTWI